MSGSGKTRDRVMLTARLLESLKPEAEPYRIPDMRIPALAIRVAASGEKTWDLAYRISGSSRQRRPSLGRYGDPGGSLEEARARTIELTAAARQGVDLIANEAESRDAAGRAMPMEKFVELYLDRRVRRRLRSARQVESILKRVLAPLANVPAVNVQRRDLSPLLEVIASAGHERAAGHARTLIGGLFKWGETMDFVAADPTRGLPTYDQGQPRERVLDDDEIRTVWPWFECLPPAVCDALRVQLFVGARISEIIGMTGKEIDRGKWLWTLPAARSKNGKQRVTPLVGHARTIVEARLDAAGDELLFLSERGMAMTTVGVATALYNRRNRMPVPAFTSHDLRRTMVTTMLELGGSRDVIGAIIGHEGGGGRAARTLIKHYIKSDLIARKKKALETWDEQLKDIIANEPAGNVVQYRHG